MGAFWDGTAKALAQSSTHEVLCHVVKYCSEAWKKGALQII